jgi:HlyD family secretion protein
MSAKLSLKQQPEQSASSGDRSSFHPHGADSGTDRLRPKAGLARRLRMLAFLLLSAIALAGATYYFANLKQADPIVKESTLWIDTVRRGEMLRTVRANGTLVPREIRWVPAPAEGRVERVLRKAGERVSASDVLLEVSNQVMERDLLDAKWQLSAADADLRNLTAQLDSELLDREDASTILESQLHVAELQSGRDKQLHDSGLLAKHDLDLSEAKLNELKTRKGIVNNHIAKSEAAREAQLAAQQAKVEQLRGLVELRQKQVDDLKVKAGIDGVLQQVFVEEGQQISPTTNVAKVARPDELKAELRVAEAQMRDVAFGQNVEIDTHNGKIAGKVERIDPAVEEGTVAVDVSLEGALPAVARPDLSVEGLIELERIQNALHTGRPVSAVSPAPGMPSTTMGLFRITPDGTAAERVSVKVGRVSVSHAEILEGLNEGDRVVLSDTSKWDLLDRLRLE